MLTYILFAGFAIIILLLIFSKQINNFGRLNIEIERYIKEDITENILNIKDSVNFLLNFFEDVENIKREDADALNNLSNLLIESDDYFEPKRRTKKFLEITKEFSLVYDDLISSYEVNDVSYEKKESMLEFCEYSIDKFIRDIEDLNDLIDERNDFIDNSFITKLNFVLRVDKEEKIDI